MKLIIAGGRSQRLSKNDIEAIKKIDADMIIDGGASGVDSDASKYASDNNISGMTIYADWKKEGRKAGPLRNKVMAMEADAVALFPGGKGTESMYNIAVAEGLKIFDFR